jgi:hypothetical protein
MGGEGDGVNYTIPRDHWEHVSERSRKTFKAIVICPKCNNKSSIREHAIAANGDLSPSLFCPFTPCDFHEYVTLEGWDKGALP